MNDQKDSTTWPTVEVLGWSAPSRYGACHLVVTKPGDPYDRARAACNENRIYGGQVQMTISSNVCRTCQTSRLVEKMPAEFQRPRCLKRCRPDPKNRTEEAQCVKKMYHDGDHEADTVLEGIASRVCWTNTPKETTRHE